MFATLLKKINARLLSNGTAGFTLIELLVVISVIGVLAVAVLATINPIEQINRSRDTRTRSDAQQLNAASERFYATQELYPWNKTLNTLPDTVYQFTPGTTSDAWLDELTSVDEVKAAFITRLRSNDDVWLLKPVGSSSTLETCFRPVSKALQLEAATTCENDSSKRFTINGTSTCVTTNGTINANNMICLP